MVDLNGFVALVDAIGGVDFDVPIAMDYEDPYQDLYIHIPKGMQHLSGSEAIKVVRFRAGYASQDIGRMETQQKFLKAVAKQMLKVSNLGKLNDFVRIFQTYVDTDLTLGNLAWLGSEAISIGAENITSPTLPRYLERTRRLYPCGQRGRPGPGEPASEPLRGGPGPGGSGHPLLRSFPPPGVK